MEKRSRRRIRDLVTQLASQGLSENENGRARISMMAKSNERSTHGPDTEAQDQSPHHSHLACNTRPVHTDGSTSVFGRCLLHARFSPDIDHIAGGQFGANSVKQF
jgi:hypothetical protein